MVEPQLDFTGYWVLSRTENFDEFLRALGMPWVVRKAAIKFGNSAVDVIAHTGTSVKITTLNAKGSWTRTYDTEQTIQQTNAEGVACTTTTNWEGMVLHSRTDGSSLGSCESWRYRRGDVMVVKTTVKPPGRAETSMFWFFERMQALQLHLANSKKPLLRQITKDQNRVVEATQRDNAFLQSLLANWERWSSPADDFIKLNSPKAEQSRSKQHVLSHRAPSSALTSPQSMSKSASAASLSNMATSTTTNNVSQQQQASSSTLGNGEVNQQQLGTNTGVNNNNNQPAFPTSFAAAAFEQPPLHPQAPSASIPNLPLSGSRKVLSTESLQSGGTPRRAAHFRSPSADSIPGTGSIAATPAANSPSRGGAPTGGEALMAYKMHEFLDGRGITAVVPVSSPNDTNEPQLLEMSPEQAEETAAKLRELETDMLLRRQEHARGLIICGLVISKEKYSLPEHLRVWEMTLV